MFMKDILEIRGDRRKKGLYGVEIEVEGSYLPPAVPGWRTTVDGSLKSAEAYEYVLPDPTSLKNVFYNIVELKDAIERNKGSVFDSVRAGVHVHINVQDMTVKQFFTFITCFYAVEDLLVRWCGESREGNLFCLRSGDAEYVLFQLIQAIEERNFRYLNTENVRYAALNFFSLFKYGSLEFRCMRTPSNLMEVHHWITIIDDLWKGSQKFSDPSDVIMSMSGEGEDNFIRRLLSTTWEEVIKKSPDWETLIRQSVRRVQMVAFSTDWEDVEEKSNNPFEKKVGWT